MKLVFAVLAPRGLGGDAGSLSVLGRLAVKAAADGQKSRQPRGAPGQAGFSRPLFRHATRNSSHCSLKTNLQASSMAEWRG